MFTGLQRFMENLFTSNRFCGILKSAYTCTHEEQLFHPSGRCIMQAVTEAEKQNEEEHSLSVSSHMLSNESDLSDMVGSRHDV